MLNLLFRRYSLGRNVDVVRLKTGFLSFNFPVMTYIPKEAKGLSDVSSVLPASKLMYVCFCPHEIFREKFIWLYYYFNENFASITALT